jgi:hypothetical protein
MNITRSDYHKISKEYKNEFSKIYHNFHPYILRSFEPVTFNHLEFSSANTDEYDSLKYLTNSQQEGRFEDYLKNKTWGLFTQEEFEIVSKLMEVSAKINKKIDNRNRPSLECIFAAVLATRLITRKLKRDATVLEIGPGSGYVAAILALMGYKVIILDVFPKFVVYQNLFFKYLLKDKFKYDFKLNRKEVGNFSILQLSWWNFINIKNRVLKIDGITINHSFNEIPRMAMQYYLSIFEKTHKSFFVFIENVGWLANKNNYEYFLLKNKNYKLLHENDYNLDTCNKNYSYGSCLQYNISNESVSVDNTGNIRSDSPLSNAVRKNVKEIKLIIKFIVGRVAFLPRLFYHYLRLFSKKILILFGLNFIVLKYLRFKNKFRNEENLVNLDHVYHIDSFDFTYSYLDFEELIGKKYQLNDHDSWMIYSEIYNWDPKKHHYND